MEAKPPENGKCVNPKPITLRLSNELIAGQVYLYYTLFILHLNIYSSLQMY